MKKFLGLVLLSIFPTISAFTYAHHSAVLLYQMDQHVEVEGVVTKFSLGNPHTRIYLMVKNENGEEEEWLAEGGSRTVMIRNGWTGDEIQPGMRIKILGNPSRDGSNLVHCRELVFPDGRQVYVEDLNPYIIEDKRKNRRRE